ncbi:MAG: divalent-cation tolerance protein CutA [Acidobacteria bacterium]|nr:divalent-cation tolerance protein CutA [Acidobacteriota bacterium]
MSDVIWCYVTCPNRDVAKNIATTALQQRLIACANLFAQAESMYWWDGVIQTDEECVLICKTRKAQYAKLQEAIKEMHPYDCPCILALPVTEGNPGFLDWIQRETS